MCVSLIPALRMHEALCIVRLREARQGGPVFTNYRVLLRPAAVRASASRAVLCRVMAERRSGRFYKSIRPGEMSQQVKVLAASLTTCWEDNHLSPVAL